MEYRDTTHIRAAPIQRPIGNPNNTRTRARSSYFEKWTIMKLLHQHHGSIPDFKGIWEFKKKSRGPLRMISKQTIRTLQNWRTLYAPNTADWLELDSYCKKASEQLSRNTYTWQPGVNDPNVIFQPRVGKMPVLECFVLRLRYLKAQAHELRSVRWMRGVTRMAVTHPIISHCLQQLMSNSEKRTVSSFKISKGFVRRFLVCVSQSETET